MPTSSKLGKDMTNYSLVPRKVQIWISCECSCIRYVCSLIRDLRSHKLGTNDLLEWCFAPIGLFPLPQYPSVYICNPMCHCQYFGGNYTPCFSVDAWCRKALIEFRSMTNTGIQRFYVNNYLPTPIDESWLPRSLCKMIHISYYCRFTHVFIVSWHTLPVICKISYIVYMSIWSTTRNSLVTDVWVAIKLDLFD